MATSIIPQRLAFANTLRGLAALSVLVAHFLDGFWSSQDAISGLINMPPLHLTMVSYFAPLHFSVHFSYGSFGVALFFLISGFVIPFSLAGLSPQSFLIARFFRIYPVYVICLTISLLSIWLLGSIINDRTFPHSLEHIVINALLLRGWFWSIPSIDGLSWTLEIEIVFYMIVAIMAPFIIGSKSSGGYGIIVYALVGCLICILGVNFASNINAPYQGILYYATFALPFTIFMFSGTFFYLYLNSKIGAADLVSGLIASLFGFSVSMSAHPSLKELVIDSYYLAMIVFTACFFAKDSFKSNFILDALAKISYPLYAVHAIVGYSTMYVLVSKNIAPWIAASCAFCIAISLAYVLHKAVELPTMRFGKNLAKKLYQKDPRP